MDIAERYMQRCIQLARKGFGDVAPNPMVGCVIVFNEEVIAEGFHEKYGDAHAEVNAINAVSDKELLASSTLYVNLEPCSHYGKTPPCADLIVQYKIPRVVIGCMDSHSLVKGKGIEHLKQSGCDVEMGVLEDECRNLNHRFFTYHEKKRPYVILKWAQTADGFIDINRDRENIGEPSRISNESSRKLLHKWRSEEQAIMIGTNTALLDNPKLTVREWEGRNPLRIVLDKWLRIPETYNVFDKSAPTIVFSGIEKKSKQNIEYVTIDFGKDILPQVFDELYKRAIQSLIVEGGEVLLTTFIQKELWDEARVFIAGKEFGKGVKAPEITAKIDSTENISGDLLHIYKPY